MKAIATVWLLACLLIPASVVVSQGRSPTDFPVRENAIQIDGHRFDKRSSFPGKESIRREALSLVRGGGKAAGSASLPLDRRFPPLPNSLRPSHSMNYTTNGIPSEIRTGRFSGARGKDLFTPSKGWEYHETGTGIAMGMAIKNQGGRKSIVLIDLARKTFLSISN